MKKLLLNFLRDSFRQPPSLTIGKSDNISAIAHKVMKRPRQFHIPTLQPHAFFGKLPSSQSTQSRLSQSLELLAIAAKSIHVRKVNAREQEFAGQTNNVRSQIGLSADKPPWRGLFNVPALDAA
eukprot:3939381-Rhodomonas_salina.1